jgi:hypothetical protein
MLGTSCVVSMGTVPEMPGAENLPFNCRDSGSQDRFSSGRGLGQVAEPNTPSRSSVKRVMIHNSRDGYDSTKRV